MSYTKINHFIARYLAWASPFVVILLVVSALIMGSGKQGTAAGVVLDVLGIHFLIWLALLLYFLVTLLISSSMREMILTRVARIRERDEREELITGQATRASWLATFALLIFLFLVSGLQVSVQEQPPAEAGARPRRSVSVGYRFSLLQPTTRAGAWPPRAAASRTLFSFSGVALSNGAMLLVLLFWHVLTLHLFSRKIARNC